MSGFNTDLPSVRQVQTYIKDKQEVELKLMTDDLLVGKVFWQDDYCICLLDQYDKPILIWRHSLVYIKPKA